MAERYYKVIGQHFDETKHFDKAERFYIKARCPQMAVEMYTRANKWDKAHKVASTYMSEAAVGTLYVNQARRLEAAGKLKEAEKLYIMVNEPDEAINMYKKNRHYDQMIRLVTQYRKDLLTETHLHLAQQLEAENKFKEAERHYVDSNDWKSAVNMYRAHDLWDDAIRVAKGHGGVNASKQVAYAWAVSLGGEAGAKLLTKFGLIEQAIDYATESGNFEQAFQLARTSMKTKLPEVHPVSIYTRTARTHRCRHARMSVEFICTCVRNRHVGTGSRRRSGPYGSGQDVGGQRRLHQSH